MILLVVKEQFPNSSFRIGCSSLLGGVDMAVSILTSFCAHLLLFRDMELQAIYIPFFCASEKKTKTAN